MTADFAGDDFHPVFSPDGERIAFCSRRDGGGIFVMGATGESPRKVSDDGFYPAWSPDGRKLAYTTERVNDPTSRASPAALWVVDVETLEEKKLTDGDAVGINWSPNGRRIAYWSYWYELQGQRDILTLPAEGGTPVPVTNDVATDWGPLWSPDGRRLIGSLFRDGWKSGVMEFDERGVDGLDRPVVLEPIEGSGGFDTLLWSPDGAHLYGMAEDEQGEFVAAIYSFRTERHELMRYPDGSHVRSWSYADAWLDNDRVALWDDELHQVMVVRIDGSAAQAVTDVPGPGGIGFADNGRTLVMNRTTTESDIWLLELGD